MTGLTFEESTHTYRFNGQIVPSVTQVLTSVGMIDPTYFTEESRIRGTAIHLACELDDLGVLDESTVDERIMPCLHGWRKARASKAVGEIIGIEERLYSPPHRCAGTMDRRTRIGNRVHAMELKTGDGPWQEWWKIQLAGYVLLDGAKMANRAVTRLYLNGSVEVIPISPATITEDINLFISALSIHNWNLLHGGKQA